MANLMKEDEIAALESTAEDYGLENYPISGAQLSALIATLRHYEAGVSKARPIVMAVHEHKVLQQVNERWAVWRSIAIMGFLPVAFFSIWLTGTFQRFQDAMSIGEASSSFWVALGMMILSILIPYLIFFVPAMKWIDKKAQEDFDARARL